MDNEVLITEEEDYTILRKKVNGNLETFVVVPLKDFNKDGNSSKQKVEKA